MLPVIFFSAVKDFLSCKFTFCCINGKFCLWQLFLFSLLLSSQAKYQHCLFWDLGEGLCLHFWPYFWKLSLCFSSIVKPHCGESPRLAAPARHQVSKVNLTASCSCCRVFSRVSRAGGEPLAVWGPAASSWSLWERGSATPHSQHRAGTGGSSDRAVLGVCPRALIHLLCGLESHPCAVVLSVWVFAMCFSRIVRYFLLEIHRNFVKKKIKTAHFAEGRRQFLEKFNVLLLKFNVLSYKTHIRRAFFLFFTQSSVILV